MNMKKFILILGAAVIIGLIVWGVWSFILSKNQNHFSGSTGSLSPVSVTTQSGKTVNVQGVSSPQSAEVIHDFLGGIQNAAQIGLGGTVIASPYALQIWGDANKGGEALLRYASSTGWTLISFGGGEWDVLGLMQEGVPLSNAEQLVAGLTNETSTSITPSAKIPSGDTVTIGTTKGSVIMNNFYKSALYIDQGQGAVVIQQTSTYSIIYNIPDSSFGVIIIPSSGSETGRQMAETAFLSTLNISEKDACKLTVYESITGGISGQQAGGSLPLSFCGVSVGQ